jgi:hypothetical protein
MRGFCEYVREYADFEKKNAAIFWTRCENVYFSRISLHYGVNLLE